MSQARLADLANEISEMRRSMPPASGERSSGGGAPSTQPTGGWSRMARMFVELAVHQVVVRDIDAARRSAEEALVLLGLVEDRQVRANLSLTLGEVLLELHDAHRARARFETAIAIFDELDMTSAAARGRIGLSRALTMLGDPFARTILEDAGTVFEDLGDHETVREIDSELRALSADFADAPMSIKPR